MEKKQARSRPWLPKEVLTLWRLRKKGLNNREIGEKLHRSASSVTAMVSRTHDYMS